MQHDSYNCMMEGHEGSLPFPTKRKDVQYCGWGLFKIKETFAVYKKKCPLECRPSLHKEWKRC